jgi:hypothetical protein
MTRTTALIVILLAGLLLEAVAVLGMAALGVRGPLLSLGAIVPLALASFSSSLVVMHYGESGRRRRR